MSEKDYKKIFSKNLRYYMDLNGKNQMDLMNELHLSSSTVSNWCTGLKLPRMDKVQLLADYFHINKSDLIEEHSSSNNAPDYTNAATPEEFENIVKKYRVLDAHGKEMVDFTLQKEWERSTKIIPFNTPELNAASKRPDATAEDTAQTDSVMKTDSEWE